MRSKQIVSGLASIGILPTTFSWLWKKILHGLKLKMYLKYLDEIMTGKKLKIEDFELFHGENVYVVGIFSKVVTLHNQQLRGIRLAELLTAKFTERSDRTKIAIIGAGAAGIAVATKLLQDGWKSVYIFEKYSHVLPLQCGCDTRWLHPNNINWPEDGSDLGKTNFLIDSLDWEADTAGNVAYKLSIQWKKFIESHIKSTRGKPENILSQIFNVTYLKIGKNSNGHFITWTSQTNHNEQRVAGNDNRSSGKENFKFIVLCNGFGLEQHVNSYWRNESLGQPSLTGEQKNFVVSGIGDGAIIDLLRLSFLDFRPDRFIGEAIDTQDTETVVKFKSAIKRAMSNNNQFQNLMKLKNSKTHKAAYAIIKDYLVRRMRVDTRVTLHFREKNGEFSVAFEKSPATLMNKFLLFATFDTGKISLIHELNDTESSDVETIKRHGVNRVSPLKEVFTGDLLEDLARKYNAIKNEIVDGEQLFMIDMQELEVKLRVCFPQTL